MCPAVGDELKKIALGTFHLFLVVEKASALTKGRSLEKEIVGQM